MLDAYLTQLLDGKPHAIPADVVDTLQTYGVGLKKCGSHWQLSQSFELLDKTYLAQHLGDTTVLTFSQLDSTNAYLLREASEHNTLCSAEYQSAGRGRRGRVWHSPFAQNLYFSLRWDFHHLAPKIPQLSLITACCIAQTLTQLGVQHIGLKWPNDIYLDGRKLGGILVESKRFTTHEQQLVIGVGLNLAMGEEHNRAITQPWASLAQSHLQLSRNALLVALVSALKTDFRAFQAGNGEALLQSFSQFDCFLDRKVRLTQDHCQIDGIYQGIDCTTGEAIILVQGQLQRVHIGDISLRLEKE
ncbi:biotin--[acetyl-CoA-carboxylase] ligase [Spirabiliibacterium falconis]|uniref:biotin--[acetyl-CoA-carboxylase] ligase n=1 Tax=Spirabiliibacterium falconis TaxID=572023 RepID=UPI001AADB78C|nr:biotin--[acetyl-CoA-carboxylase] ligase [Spirabiliibacterium falconis]MBE2894488.1 biotin--[acetyl-CoA-carboxylase] ligase [Spirabiliibacterium falconis]